MNSNDKIFYCSYLLFQEFNPKLMVTFDYFTDEAASQSKVSKVEAEGNGGTC